MAQSFRRNLSFELVDYIPAPTQGWNPDSIPWELPEAQAPVLDNFLIRPGNIMARGSFSAIANTHSTAPSPVAAVPAGVLMISTLTTNGYMPWDAPVVGSDIGLAAVGHTTLTWVDAIGGSTTSTVASRHLIPGPRWINFDGELYGIGFDSEATALQDTAQSYFIPATQLLTQAFVTGGGPSGTSTISALAATNNISGLPAAGWMYKPVVPFHPQFVTFNTAIAFGASGANMLATNFGYAIPGSTTISDCDFTISGINTASTVSVTAQLVHSGSVIGSASTKNVPGGSSVFLLFELADFGSPTLTDAEVNSSTFGVQFKLNSTNNPLGYAAEDFEFEDAEMTITYSGIINTPGPVAHPNAPQGAIDLIGYLGALWLLAGANTPANSTAVATSAGLTSGTSYQSISITALTQKYPNGSSVYVADSTNSQTWTLSGDAAIGATTISVQPQIANATYASGSYVALAGSEPRVHSSTTIYFTNPIVAGGGDDADDWKDVHSGQTNEITIDQDSSDPGVGLAVSRTGLIIFRRNSVWLMRGTTPANFSMVQISGDVGCLDPRSIVQTDNGIYFMSLKGLMLTDGSKVQNISGTVTYTLQQAIASQQWAVLTGNGGYITSGLTSQGQILISIGQRNQAGNLVPIWSAMYDQTLAAWTRLTSNLWNADSGASNGNVYPGLIISDRVTALRSIHSVGTSFITMLEDQTLQYSFLNQSGLYDYDIAGATHAIPLNWTTRFFPIIGTASYQRKWGQAKRFMLDHSLATASPTATPGWSVTPIDATGTQYSPNDNYTMMSTVVSSGDKTSVVGGFAPVTTIQRENLDFTSEADDVSLTVQFLDPTNTGTNDAQNVVASIYGVGIEYQGYGHDRR